jgi:integrase
MSKERTQKRTFKFTPQGLKGLPIPPKPTTDKERKDGTGQVDFFDTHTRGLGLRVSYGGRKTFFVMYSAPRKDKPGHVRRRVSLGEYGNHEEGKLSLGAAHKRAKAQLGEVAKDRDPAAEARAQRQAPTVSTLAADFISMQHKRGKKSADKQEKRLARDVLPAIGHMKVLDVTRGDVKAIMHRITERGAPIEANRVHEIIRAMLSFGIEEEVYGLESNPAGSLGKHRNPEGGRERWLSTEELGKYWRALEEEPPGAAAALRLCLLTAQRQQNVLGMSLDQLALADGLWICPASGTKTSRTYRVPLSNMALGIIKARIAELEEAEQRRAKREGREPRAVTFLFPRRGGGGPAHRTFIARPHASACKRANIEGYALHDARHTFATHCDQMDIPRLIWDGLMGHAQGSMADLYSGHDFAEQRRDCMERWANRIAAALAENVVSIHAGRA